MGISDEQNVSRETFCETKRGNVSRETLVTAVERMWINDHNY